MKTIGIDARLYNQTGVGTYLKNLLFYLDSFKLKEDVVFYVYLLKKDFEEINFRSKNIIKKIANFNWHSLSEQIFFLKVLLKDKIDLMHFTYFTFPIFYHKKYILTVHDLTPFFFKTGKASTKNFLIYNIKHFIFKILFFISVLRAKKIITPTYTVKKQLINYFSFLTNLVNKIEVIYEGISFEIIKLSNKDTKFSGIYNKFFLYVGNFYPHKNIEKLIISFSKIKGNYSLVLIGPDDYFSYKIKNFIKKINDQRIILLVNLSKNHIYWFYKNCLALIHPSLSEGFGLTLVEAAYFNKPIIASNIKTFKEIWDNNYLSFNPYDINDIKEKIELFIKEKFKFNYKNILKNLSFKKMTEKILKVYLKNL